MHKSLGNGEGTLPLFWRRSTVSPVFFGRFPRSSQSPCPLSHSVPSLIGHPASVDVKQHKRKKKDPEPPGQSLRGLPARHQGGREGVRATAVQGGALSKKAAVAKFSPEPASANNTDHTTPIASREQLLERAARLQPTFLARQRQRPEAEFLKRQEADDALQRNQHMAELEAITKRIRKGRDGEPPTPFKTLLWDLFFSPWLMPEGLVGWAPS